MTNDTCRLELHRLIAVFNDDSVGQSPAQAGPVKMGMMITKNGNYRWLSLYVLIIVLDQVSKYFAESQLQFSGYHVMSHFNFSLAHNTGAAFSFLGDAGGWQRWFFIVLAFVIVGALLLWIRRLNASQKWLMLALALIIGGAMGNVIDRIAYGYVIDFIDWYAGDYHWPAFNIADSAICIGAVLLLLDGFLAKQVEA